VDFTNGFGLTHLFSDLLHFRCVGESLRHPLPHELLSGSCYSKFQCHSSSRDRSRLSLRLSATATTRHPKNPEQVSLFSRSHSSVCSRHPDPFPAEPSRNPPITCPAEDFSWPGNLGRFVCIRGCNRDSTFSKGLILREDHTQHHKRS